VQGLEFCEWVLCFNYAPFETCSDCISVFAVLRTMLERMEVAIFLSSSRIWTSWWRK